MLCFSSALISEDRDVSSGRKCYWEVIAVVGCRHHFYFLFLKGMFARLNKISDYLYCLGYEMDTVS